MTDLELIAQQERLIALAKRGLALTPTSVIITVPRGGDLQAAIDSAPNGSEIRIAPGLYPVNLRLRAAKDHLTIRSDVPDSALLLTAGGWIDGPAVAGTLVRLVPADWSLPIVMAEAGAHDYTLVGLEIGGNQGHPDRTLVELGDPSQTDLAKVPSHIDLVRCYIHGDPESGGHLGVLLGSADTAITRCYISGMLEQGRDSQAIAGWNGPGPYVIDHNYLEGSGENVLFGGSDPRIQGLIPSDITFRYNHCVKPLAWKSKPGSVKNLFELKNAQRVLVEFNVFENCWVDAQPGNGIVLTVRNQDGGGPWTIVADVIFRHNVVKNVEQSAFNIDGHDDTGKVSGRGANLRIEHNLALQVGNGVQLLNGFYPTTFVHNTLTGITGRFLSFSNVWDAQTLVVRDNVTAGGAYGVRGDNTGVGTPSLDHYAPGYVFTRNIIEGNTERTIPYPEGNVTLPYGSLIGQVDPSYRYIGLERSTDGATLGADVDAILAALPWVTL